MGWQDAPIVGGGSSAPTKKPKWVDAPIVGSPKSLAGQAAGGIAGGADPGAGFTNPSDTHFSLGSATADHALAGVADLAGTIGTLLPDAIVEPGAPESLHRAADLLRQRGGETAKQSVVPGAGLISTAAGQLATTIPLLGAGSVGAPAIFGLQQYSGSLVEGQDAGLSPAANQQQAIIRGGIEAGTTWAFNIFGKFIPGMGGLDDPTVFNTMRESIKKTGVRFASEIAEENAIALQDAVVQKLSGVNLKALDDPWQIIADTTALTAVTMGLAEAPRATSSAAKALGLGYKHTPEYAREWAQTHPTEAVELASRVAEGKPLSRTAFATLGLPASKGQKQREEFAQWAVAPVPQAAPDAPQPEVDAYTQNEQAIHEEAGATVTDPSWVERKAKRDEKLGPMQPQPAGRNADFTAAPSLDEVKAAVSEDKQGKVGQFATIPDGKPVGLRIDIPAFERHGKYVVTVHDQKEGGKVGSTLSYEPMARVQNPKFWVAKGVEKIHEGRAKFPAATVEGNWATDASIPADIDQWTPVGFNPAKETFFYDKRTGKEVLAGAEAISVGNTVFVKVPQYGTRQSRWHGEAPSGPSTVNAPPKGPIKVPIGSPDQNTGTSQQGPVNQSNEQPEAHEATVARKPGFKKRGEVSIGLSAATDSIHGVAALVKRARGGDDGAKTQLNKIAEDQLSHLTAGLKTVKIHYDSNFGMYHGDGEPSLGVRVTFEESERKHVLAAVAKFAENFNQEQIHVRQRAKEPIGHDYGDGSYATPVVRIMLKDGLTNREVALLTSAAGLEAITVNKKYLEAYYVGNAQDEPAVRRWTDAVERLHESLGDRRGKTLHSTARIWVYGRGDGAVGYERIRGDVRPGSVGEVKTAGRLAEAHVGRKVKPAPQAKEMTVEQRARHEDIADSYDRLPDNDLANPLVRKAYEAANREIKDQYGDLTIKVEAWADKNDQGEWVARGGEPYKSSDDMRRDLLENNHLYFFVTTPGQFGPDGVTYEDHPLLRDFGEKSANGYPMLYNDALRVVHDYYAHGLSPVQFGPRGEEAAWKNHMAMTKNPLAKWAITTETRGQNSWVNFNTNVPPDSKLTDRPFARQKVGLLPIEYVRTGNKAVDADVKALAKSLSEEDRLGSDRNKLVSPKYTLAQRREMLGKEISDAMLDEEVMALGPNSVPLVKKRYEQLRYLDGQLADLAKIGENAHGGYEEGARLVSELIGPQRARLWAFLNSAFSAQNAVAKHTNAGLDLALRLADFLDTNGRTPTETEARGMFDDTIRDVNAGNVATETVHWPKAWAVIKQGYDAAYTDVKSQAKGNKTGHAIGKLPGFARSSVGDVVQVVLDTYMARLIDPKLTNFKYVEGKKDREGRVMNRGQQIKAKQKQWIANDNHYIAYSARVRKIANEMGIKAGQAQERIWAAIYATLGLKNAGVPVEEMTHEDVRAAWNLSKILLESKDVQAVLERHGIDADAIQAVRDKAPAIAREYRPNLTGPVTKDVRAGFKRVSSRLKPTGATEGREVSRRFSADIAADEEVDDSFEPEEFSGDVNLDRRTHKKLRTITKPVIELPWFKRWFGDWSHEKVNSSRGPTASQVVDEAGRPRVVYHATKNQFTRFEVGRETVNSGTFGPWDTNRHGLFFAEDASFAEEYIGKQPGAHVKPVYLNIRHPADLTGKADIASDLSPFGINARWVNQHLGTNAWEMLDGSDGKAFVSALREAGYDGAYMVEEGADGKEHAVWVALDPTQVKSATGNRGTFNPEDPDILRASTEGEPEQAKAGQRRQMRFTKKRWAPWSNSGPETQGGGKLLREQKQPNTKVGERTMAEFLADAVSAMMIRTKSQLNKSTPGKYLGGVKDKTGKFIVAPLHHIWLRSEAGYWHELGHAFSTAFNHANFQKYKDWVKYWEPALEQLANSQNGLSSKPGSTEEGLAEAIRLYVTDQGRLNVIQVANKSFLKGMDEILSALTPVEHKALRDSHRLYAAHMQKPYAEQAKIHSADQGYTPPLSQRLREGTRETLEKFLNGVFGVSATIDRTMTRAFETLSQEKQSGLHSFQGIWKLVNPLMPKAERKAYKAKLEQAKQAEAKLSEEIGDLRATYNTLARTGLEVQRILQPTDGQKGVRVMGSKGMLQKAFGKHWQTIAFRLKQAGIPINVVDSKEGEYYYFTDKNGELVKGYGDIKQEVGEKNWADFEKYGQWRTVLNRYRTYEKRKARGQNVEEPLHPQWMEHPIHPDPKNPGASVKELVNEYERNHPEWRKSYKDMQLLFDSYLGMAALSGEVSAREALRMKKNHFDYWPLGRIQRGDSGEGRLDPREIAQDFKKEQGSDLPFRPLDETAYGRTEKALRAFNYTRLFKTHLALTRKMAKLEPDLKKKVAWMRTFIPLKVDLKAVEMRPDEEAKIIADGINRLEAQKLGLSVSQYVKQYGGVGPGDVAISTPHRVLWREAAPQIKENVMSIVQGHTKHYYYVPSPLDIDIYTAQARPFDNLPAVSATFELLGKAIKPFSRVVTRSLPFAAMNTFFRDPQTALLSGKGKRSLIPMLYLYTGLRAVVRRDVLGTAQPSDLEGLSEHWNTFANASMPIRQLPVSFMKMLTEGVTQIDGVPMKFKPSEAGLREAAKSWVGAAASVVLKPFDTVNWASGGWYLSPRGEALGRIGAYIDAINQQRTQEQAVAAGDNSTANFNQRGTSILFNLANMQAMFLSARQQVAWSFYRQLRDPDPRVRGLALMKLPYVAGMHSLLLASLYLALHAVSDDEDKEKLKEWLKTENDRTDSDKLRLGRLPLLDVKIPFDDGLPGMFASMGWNATLKALNGDDPVGEAAKIAGETITNLGPSVSQWVNPYVRTAVEVKLNYNLYYGEQIVPPGVASLHEPRQQTLPSTPGVYNWAAENVANVSPLKIRHVVSNIGMKALDQTAAFYDKKVPREKSNVPILGSLFAKEPRGWGSQPVKELNEFDAKFEAAKNDLKKLAGTDPERAAEAYQTMQELQGYRAGWSQVEALWRQAKAYRKAGNMDLAVQRERDMTLVARRILNQLNPQK